MLINRCEQFSPPVSFLLVCTGETCCIFCKISLAVRALVNVSAWSYQNRYDWHIKLVAELSALPGRVCVWLTTLARCYNVRKMREEKVVPQNKVVRRTLRLCLQSMQLSTATERKIFWKQTAFFLPCVQDSISTCLHGLMELWWLDLTLRFPVMMTRALWISLSRWECHALLPGWATSEPTFTLSVLCEVCCAGFCSGVCHCGLPLL